MGSRPGVPQDLEAAMTDVFDVNRSGTPKNPSGEELREHLDSWAGLHYSFTVTEFSDGAALPRSASESALLDDSRFLRIGVDDGEESAFISKSALFRWLMTLNLRLGRIRRASLTPHQLESTLSSMRPAGVWRGAASTALAFGRPLGLIGMAYETGQYVFPLAGLLSGFNRADSTKATGFLRWLSIQPFKAPSIPFQVQQALSALPGRVRTVIQAREALVSDSRLTLEEIGNRLGLTRERIRQIEAKFWREVRSSSGGAKKAKHTNLYRRITFPLMEAFLLQYLAEGGRVLLDSRRRDFRYQLFLTKCLGVDYLAISNTRYFLPKVIAGKSHQYTVPVARPSDDRFAPSTAEEIAAQLSGDSTLILHGADTFKLAVALATGASAKLNKSQRVYLVLKTLGGPSHFSKVARHYNSQFPSELSTEHAIHAILSRESYGVTWVRSKGMYALREWGFNRPEQGLFESVTETVTVAYSETGKPVPASLVRSKLEEQRPILVDNSVSFATDFNPAVRFVLPDSFVPVAAVDAEYDVNNDRAFVGDQVDDELTRRIDLLPASGIAGPEFVGKAREAVAHLNHHHSIGHLKRLLYTGVGSPALIAIFNSRGRTLYAEAAISRLTSAINSWTDGRVRDSRVTWVIPEGVEFNRSLATQLTEDRGYDLAEKIQTCVEAGTWLPFISLELVHVVRQLSATDLAILRRMAFRACRQAGPSAPSDPWSPGFPQEISQLSLYWLYQFEPRPEAFALLRKLHEAYCTNVGHLRSLHPEAWQLIHSTHSSDWNKLTLAVRRATSLSPAASLQR